MRLDAKWYAFIGTDSYVFWPNFVGWLSELDSRKPWYIGSTVSIGVHSFAYGGADTCFECGNE